MELAAVALRMTYTATPSLEWCGVTLFRSATCGLMTMIPGLFKATTSSRIKRGNRYLCTPVHAYIGDLLPGI